MIIMKEEENYMIIKATFYMMVSLKKVFIKILEKNMNQIN